MLHDLAPVEGSGLAGGGSHDLVADNHRGCRQFRGSELVHFGVQLRKFKKILGQIIVDLVHVGDLTHSVEEPEGTGLRDIEVQSHEHGLLHLQDLLLRISVVGNIHQVLHNRGVNFLILCGDHEGRYTNQLKFSPVDLLDCHESVDEVDCDEEGLGKKLELLVDVDEPVDQNCSHAFSHISLLLHVLAWSESRLFLSDHVVLDLFTIF